MAEITHKRKGELVRAVFAVLLDAPEGKRASDVLNEIQELVPPTEYERGTYADGSPKYTKIVRFSTIGAVKAGWLVKDKGVWRLTPEGLTAYQTFSDPEAFDVEASRLYNEWKKAQPEPDADTSDDAEEVSTTLEEAEEAAWNEIRTYLAAMPPYEFQELVASLLKAMGYHVDWIAPKGADGGIDIVAYTDPLGTSGTRMKVQVKRHPENKAGPDAIRAFLAVLGEQDVGLFVCTGGFTAEAQREARSQEKRRLVLLDDNRLVDLWAEHYEGLADEARQRLPLRTIHFLAPSE
jgi:restriction system protein